MALTSASELSSDCGWLPHKKCRRLKKLKNVCCCAKWMWYNDGDVNWKRIPSDAHSTMNNSNRTKVTDDNLRGQRLYNEYMLSRSFAEIR